MKAQNSSFSKTEYLLLFFSALLTLFSHPLVFQSFVFPQLNFLVWLAYVPLFMVCEKASIFKQWKASFIYAFLSYLGLFYWLYTAMSHFGGLSLFASLFLLFVLIFLLALYFSVIFYLSAWVCHITRLSRFLVLPLFWVSIEYFRSYFPFGGFPWGQVAYSLQDWLGLIQIIDITGVYGLTAFIVWVNILFADWISSVGKEVWKNSKYFFASSLVYRTFFVLSVFVIFIVYSAQVFNRIKESQASAAKLKVALLQGNIPQDEKWLFEKAEDILKDYQDQSSAAITKDDVDLVIWPEASFPYEFPLNRPDKHLWVGNFEKDLLLGAVTYLDDGSLSNQTLYTPLGYPVFNSAILFGPNAKLKNVYHKQKLVPFGETIPLKNYLPFAQKLTAGLGEFQAGNSFELLNSGEAQIGSLICYEDIFPSFAQQFTQKGANLLVNFSNDAWYGDSSALPQHLSFSIFRAIENHRTLLRVTNTGMTAQISPLGEIEAGLPKLRKETLVTEASLYTEQSFYSRYGDVFAWLCVGMSFNLILLTLLKMNHHKPIND